MGRPLPPSVFSVNNGREDIVILGLPGPWADNNCEASDHYTTKIGGLPDWPVSTDEINRDLLKCGVCGGELALVAQVYSPLDTDPVYIEERVLYVFGCPALNCGISPLSWRTIRVQKNTTSDSTQSCNAGGSSFSEGSSATNSNRPRVHTNNDLQGEQEQSSDMDEWWDDEFWRPSADGEEGESFHGSLDMQELGRALQEAGFAIANQNIGSNSSNQISGIRLRNQNADTVSGHGIGDANCVNNDIHANRSNVNGNNLPVLPCFYIYCQNEVYHPGNRGRLEEFTHHNFDVGDVEVWEGEEYEPGRALNADRTYLKFKKRLDYYPEQCFRYCFGGKPLLANRDQGDPGICTHCGAPRTYEMQLMPPLLYYLQQACKDMPSLHSANNWEWLTIFVYTCAQSCTKERATVTEKEWVIIEEATIVQYET
eukprot:TRINITY_DN19873_c0_g2_i2.p1 TRINITY_DN19873_c0_g2~~TRINITY_DN19873_c0_g2_i2.p1  ORF type:complete len:426 (-),score=64.09 TRINITY_DN19873_c0_g2_i2:353-1630(-)